MMFYQMVTHPAMTLSVQTYNLFSAKPIDTKEKAIEVGEYMAHKLYDGTNWVDFSRYEETPQVSESDEVYSVWYRPHAKKEIIPDCISLPEGQPRERWYYPIGGGGPYIDIEKSTGKIIDFGLQK